MTYSPHITHILGMAKSSLDLRGAKASKLELDFMKLLVATDRIQADGAKAQGYLLVFTEKIEATIKGWCQKYGTGNSIKVLRAILDPAAEVRIRAEKLANAKGLLEKPVVDDATIEAAEEQLSVAKEGKQIGESQLRILIESRHPGILCLSEIQRTQMPLQTAWDFYGTIRFDIPLTP